MQKKSGKIFKKNIIKFVDLIFESKQIAGFFGYILAESSVAIKNVLKAIIENEATALKVKKNILDDVEIASRLLEISNENSQVGTKNLIKREIWLENTLKEIPNGHRILDAGAGELQYKKFCSHLEYVSQDFGRYDGKGNEIGLQMQTWDNSKLDIVSDITSIPVQNESFDAIMCIEVFEHLPEPANAVREFSRIIKKGGELIISAPFCSLTHFAPYYFGNGYSSFWYEKILSEAGFKIKEIVPNGNYFEYLAQEMRRVQDVAAKYAKEELKLEEQIAKNVTLAMLERFSKKDSGSSELLNFGYHIRAEKL